MTQMVFVEFLGGSTNHSNGRKHWSQRHREAKRGYWQTKLAVTKNSIAAENEVVDLVFVPQVGKGGRRLDCTNYSHTAKIIEDGLVKAGVIPGDEPWHVESVLITAPIRDWSRPQGMWVIIQASSRAQEVRELLEGAA